MERILANNLYLSSLNQTNNKDGSKLGKDEFMKILLAQLGNQDPLNPMEDREFISQMATFSSLEQMMNINQVLTEMQSGQTVGNQLRYSELIDKEITWTEISNTDAGEEIVNTFSDRVVAVHYKGNEVKVEVSEGKLIEIAQINEISSIEKEDVV